MCNQPCRLCANTVISQTVTFNGTNLVINVPSGCFVDNQNYCLIVANNIPSTATINAPVVITIGSGTVQYPLVKYDCSPVIASEIGTRTRYKVKLETTPTSGVFRMQNKLCAVNRNLRSVNGTAPVATTATETNE